MEKGIRIAAVVVTYNRKTLLMECLESLINQTYPLDAIYIIDNASTDGTPELLIEKGFINKVLSPINEPIEDIKTIKLPAFDKKVDIHYVRMHENTGGAGGFHEGVKRGYEAGYDWLWLMDDDCIPLYNALKYLTNHNLFLQHKTVALCNTVLKTDKNILFAARRRIKKNFEETNSTPLDYKNDYFEINLLSFVGVLLRSKIVKKIGLPLKEYFIYYDDIEYSMRLSKIGKIYVISKSKVLHKATQQRWIDNEITWRLFFRTRNAIHLYSRHILNSNTNLFNKFYLFSKFVLIKKILKPLLRPYVKHTYKGKKNQYFKILIKAIFHGLFGKFDNSLVELNKLINK